MQWRLQRQLLQKMVKAPSRVGERRAAELTKARGPTSHPNAPKGTKLDESVFKITLLDSSRQATLYGTNNAYHLDCKECATAAYS